MIYRIASWNMRNLSRSAKRDYSKIAEIIRGEQIDVIACQEILSEGSMLPQFKLYGWDYRWDKPSEARDFTKLEDMLKNDTRGEGYAYMWDARKWKLAGEEREFKPRIINAKSRDVGIMQAR